MKNISELEKEKCNGCSACFNFCPKNAIVMQENNEGFKYPVIDMEKCTNCGLCVKSCSVINANFQNYPPRAMFSLLWQKIQLEKKVLLAEFFL